MKKIMLIALTLTILMGCTSKNGNSISKAETTIYKNNNHDEYVIEEGFNYIKDEFTKEDTFYHASLLTIEYGSDNSLEQENTIKNELNAYEVLFIKFSFKTGDVEYEAMKSNQVYNYETYLVKYHEKDDWHIYKMDGKSE